MATMDLASHGQKLLLVSLATGEVRTYQDRQLVDSFQLDHPATALRFGRFGREENVLLIVDQGRWGVDVIGLGGFCFIVRDT